MKTILYQPIFINPQAYFVFPQLYHIEKGDSYIEPANITGQLIIQNLSCNAEIPEQENSILLVDGTPILLVDEESLLLAQQNARQAQYDYTDYKYTNSIDFDRFKGCHIRISQYTNIGAVVLGEWYIPGTPTPPESELEQLDENEILKSLVVHYNIGKQGANSIKTTSSLTDYSGNNRNATCKNFDWNSTEFVDDGKAIRLNGNGNCIVGIDMPQLDKYTIKSYVCPEHDFHIIAMGEQMKVINNWSPLASISTFGFRATDNQIEFAGSTDGGTMTYILDDTDVTKFTIQYTNTAGEGNVYLIIGDRQYDVISGQPQTYSASGSVKLEFLNMEEINNFAGTIKFTNVN